MSKLTEKEFDKWLGELIKQKPFTLTDRLMLEFNISRETAIKALNDNKTTGMNKKQLQEYISLGKKKKELK